MTQRLPDLILEQDPNLPNVTDQGHDWFVYRIDAANLHVEPSRADHAHAEREPDFVTRVVCKKAFSETPEKIFEEIVRQVKRHYESCGN